MCVSGDAAREYLDERRQTGVGARRAVVKPYLIALNQALAVAAGIAHGQRLVKSAGIGQVEAVQVDVWPLVVVVAIVLVIAAPRLAVGIQHPG